jgi:tetratricopeptide (TPR) repeat protein
MTTDQPRKPPPVVIGLGLAVLALATYAPLFFGDYQFLNIDDDEYVTENPHVTTGLTGRNIRWALTAFHSYNWHPLTWVSLQLDAELYGLDPWGFHLTNVLLHAANTVVLFWLLARLTGAVWRSAAVAAFFAVHPLHVESVAWIAERKDVLSTLLWLLTIGAYARYAARPAWGRYLLVAVLFTLGLMAKPMVVTLPCVLLLLDYWPLRRFRPGRAAASSGPPPVSVRRLVLEKLPLFALVAVCSVLTVRAQQQIVMTLDNLTLGVRVRNALVSFVVYAVQALWPVGLSVFYPHSGPGLPVWQAAGAALLLAVVTILALWATSRPYLAVGWLWYLGTLVPVIGLVQVGNQAHADRYTYVPLIGLSIMVVWGSADLLRGLRCPRWLPAAAAAALLAACTVGTWLQLRHWQNSLTLWQHAIEVTRPNGTVHYGLALALEQRGDFREAERHYKLAMRIDRTPEAHTNFGIFLKKRGRVAEARRQFNAALRRYDGYAPAHWNLGVIFQQEGKFDQAREHFQTVLRLRPGDVDAHYNLGTIAQQEGKLDEAREHFAAVVQARPEDADALFHLGAILQVQGEVQTARGYFEDALEVNPRHARAHCNLGVLFWNAGYPEEALDHFRTALAIDPNLAVAHHNLGVYLEEKGKLREARRHYRRAVQLDPHDRDAKARLKRLRAKRASVE